MIILEDGTNYLSKKNNISLNLNGRYIWENDLRQWCFYLRIDELTTIDEIIKNWKKIEKTRDKLIIEYGRNFDIYKNAILAYLLNYKNKINTRSINKIIAGLMNFDALVYSLCIHNNDEELLNQIQSKKLFYNLLDTFNVCKNDINVYEESAKIYLLQNKLPWDLEYTGPITREMVRHNLNYFSKTTDTKHIENTGLIKLMTTWKFLINNDYWDKTIKEIKNNYPDQYSKYKNLLNNRKKEILGFFD